MRLSVGGEGYDRDPGGEPAEGTAELSFGIGGICRWIGQGRLPEYGELGDGGDLLASERELGVDSSADWANPWFICGPWVVLGTTWNPGFIFGA